MNAITQGLIRHALTAAGAYFVAKGKITAGDADAIIGALTVLGATGWSVFSKKA